MGDKQEQTAASGSLAIQAGGNVTYHGLSVAEVKELCVYFLRENFPLLRAEAKEIAEEHVRAFADVLEKKLISSAGSIILDKFREPDVQAAINDAINSSARRGTSAHPHLLASLIAERVAISSNDYKEIVLSEAVNVAPRLTAEHIAFLSFELFVKSMTIGGVSSLKDVESYAAKALTFSAPGFNLSSSQRQHIQFAGACSINHILGGNIYEALRTGPYASLGFNDDQAFKDNAKWMAPSFLKLLEQSEKDNLFLVTLTSVGQAIAIANISNHFGALDYGTWLK